MFIIFFFIVRRYGFSGNDFFVRFIDIFVEFLFLLIKIFVFNGLEFLVFIGIMFFLGIKYCFNLIGY